MPLKGTEKRPQFKIELEFVSATTFSCGSKKRLECSIKQEAHVSTKIIPSLAALISSNANAKRKCQVQFRDLGRRNPGKHVTLHSVHAGIHCCQILLKSIKRFQRKQVKRICRRATRVCSDTHGYRILLECKVVTTYTSK